MSDVELLCAVVDDAAAVSEAEIEVTVVKVVNVSVDAAAEEETEVVIEEAVLDATLLELVLRIEITRVEPEVVIVVDAAAAVLVAVVKEIRLPPLDSSVTVCPLLTTTVDAVIVLAAAPVL